jgi:Protein of unknown function (DUF2628)
MTIFTVYLPSSAEGRQSPLEGIVFVRDGFSVPAFLFGPFWLLWNRAWIAAAGWALLLAFVAGLGALLKIPTGSMAWAGLAAALILGFEGERLLAWSLRRKGYVESDVVFGENEEEAEEVFFHRWEAGGGAKPLPAETRA